MCGICGVVTREANHPLTSPERLERMRDTMRHRGPDDADVFRADFVGLGQRRLSIIDLAGGAQPMPSNDEKLWVLNNGEIYNFQELRRDLERQGHRFQTQSDTEVIIYAYRQYGEDCVRYLRGMFALAVWDVERKRVFLARDRVGKKPLYYAVLPTGLQFASELKALLVDDALPREIDPQAVADYLTYTNVPSPLTIFKGIHKLPPGHALSYTIEGELNIWRYWQWNRLADPISDLSYDEAIARLHQHLETAVRLRLISDVPLGALLSGGIDSTAVVAMMSRLTDRPVKTFTIGFDVARFDESDAARTIAEHFGTEHHELTLQPESIQDVAPMLARQYDEPFADSSALPTYYVCKMARQEVTVALSGDGGDEGFGGYTRYHFLAALSQIADRVPLSLRKAGLAPMLSFMPTGMFGRQTAYSIQLSPADRYQVTMSQFLPDEQAALLRPEWRVRPRELVADYIREADGVAYLNAMQNADMNVYLPADILVKVDRASMLNSLEVRSPLLDHELLEFVGRLPPKWVFRKRILKDAIRDWVPAGILTRPKTGFGVPLGSWFKGSYKDYLREVLFDQGARWRSIFQPEVLETLYQQDRARFPMADYKLWTILMFELWAQTYATL
jgi:asparagine synthase (glutamine-hydrolysing)